MGTTDALRERVHRLYWEHDLNCATTLLRILAEREGPVLGDQVLDAALGLHGAGGYGAQCGLVEGPLLFLGLSGKTQGWSRKEIIQACRAYAEAFEARFGSLQCRVLRPEGFGPHVPPHRCEELTCAAATFAVDFLEARKRSAASHA